MDGKHICERKFSISWTSFPEPDGPSLMLVLSPFIQYKAESESHSYRKSGKPNLPDADWIQQNLSHIIYEWKEVLDALDVQTTLSV